MSDKYELKPCPFCGGHCEVVEALQTERFFIACTTCDTDSGFYKTIEEAVEAWNHRVKIDEPVESGCSNCQNFVPKPISIFTQ